MGSAMQYADAFGCSDCPCTAFAFNSMSKICAFSFDGCPTRSTDGHPAWKSYALTDKRVCRSYDCVPGSPSSCCTSTTPKQGGKLSKTAVDDGDDGARAEASVQEQKHLRVRAKPAGGKIKQGKSKSGKAETGQSNTEKTESGKTKI